jgi:threonine dehydrogenase-like Zn-dependent dehydrogenase
MLAAVLHAPGDLRVEEVPEPSPAAGEVLVDTSLASICGSDLHYMHDPAQTFPARPGSPGHESVGVVVESRSPAFSAGERVLLAPDGEFASAFSERQTCPDRFLVKLPEDADPARFVLAQQLGTVIWAMKRFAPEPVDGGTAVVIGAGSAGLFFVQLLRERGFDQVLVSDLSAHRLALAEKYGATNTVNATNASIAAAAMEATDGVGADLVVEAVGRDVARREAIGALKMRGRFGMFGLPEGPEATLGPLEPLFRRQASVETSRRAQHEPGLASFREAVDALATGRIQADGLVSHQIPLAELDRAIELAASRSDKAIKVCVAC